MRVTLSSCAYCGEHIRELDEIYRDLRFGVECCGRDCYREWFMHNVDEEIDALMRDGLVEESLVQREDYY